MSDGWIDSHCHLADPIFESRIDEVIKDARAAGVTGFIQGGVDPSDWQRQSDLARKYPGSIWTCFGVHPWFVADHATAAPEKVQTALDSLPAILPNAIACGEMGLDFGPKRDPRSHVLQTQVFEAQLEIARVARKPVVLHVVHAHAEALAILRTHRPERGGIVHAFSGSYEIARQYLDLGLTISVGEAVARPKGYETLKRAIAKLPADGLVLETDTSGPADLPRIADTVGRLRGVDPIEILRESRKILIRIFELESVRQSL